MKALEDLFCQDYGHISFRPIPGSVKLKPHKWSAKGCVLTMKACEYRDIVRPAEATEYQQSVIDAVGREIERRVVKALMAG